MSFQRHRPPRLDRLFQGVNPIYFVTFNTHARKQLLANAAVHDAFRSFGKEAAARGIAIGCYVIMPDHVHFFVALNRTGISLPAMVRALRTVLGKTLLAMGNSKPHWQEGFFDHLLRTGESYGEKWEYVRLNPVRAGLVEQPEEWPYQGEITQIRF